MTQRPFRPLANHSSICYANSLFQILFHTQQLNNFFTDLQDDDPFKLLYQKYFDGNTDTITNTTRLYSSLSFFRNPEQFQDIPSFVHQMCRCYQTLNEMMQTSEEDTDTAFPFIQISHAENLQIAIDNHLQRTSYSQTNPILCISIDRSVYGPDGNLINSKSNMKLQKCITFTTSMKTSFYKLQGIIIHTGYTTSGHFQCIVIDDEEQIFCNDAKIKRNVPLPKINQNKVERHTAFLVYVQIDFAKLPRNYATDYFTVCNPTVTEVNTSQATQSCSTVTEENEIKLPVCHAVDPSREVVINEEYHPTSLEGYVLSSNTSDSTINISQHITDLHGFLRTDPEGSPPQDYICDKPKYQTILNNLAKFTRVLSRIRFNFKVSQGDDNLALLADRLRINTLLPTEAQIIEAATRVEEVFNINKTKKNLDVESIEKVLYAVLQNIIETTQTDETQHILHEREDNSQLTQNAQSQQELEECQLNDPRDISRANTVNVESLPQLPNFESSSLSDPNGSDEEEMFKHDELGRWYKWRERMSDFSNELIEEAISKLLEELQNSSETQDTRARNLLKQNIINEYLRTSCKNVSQFAQKWVRERNVSRIEGEITYTERYVCEIIEDYLNDDLKPTKKRGGAPSKVTRETLKCLLCTVLDYPDATDAERTEYLNTYGPNINSNISVSTVNRALSKMNITIQTPSFSPIQRNSLGYRIARVLWSKTITEIKDDANTLICFVDEAAVSTGKRGKARGYASVRPCVNKPFKVSQLSVLACVVPNIGPIYRWYKGSVTNLEYARFIRDIVYILRRYVCNSRTQICVIQDNASIHKTDHVIETAEKLNINLINTVPYSPQLNLPAENMFAQLKFNALYRFKGNPNEEHTQNPVQRNFKLPVRGVIEEWDNYMQSSYTYQTTANVFGAWIHVLNECLKGKALYGIHYTAETNFAANAVNNSITICRMREE